MDKTRAQALTDFKKFFDRLSYTQDYSTTFSAFLDFCLWRLAPQCWDHMKEDMIRLDKMFDIKYVPDICEMFENWSIASDDDGAGFYDALGDLFMDCVSFGRNGQFFTPQPVCDMMAQLTYGGDLTPGKTVCDPTCGSGRMLLAIAKMQRRLKFYGADNDITCVKMTAINMIVNCMEGEIAWMNTLSMEHYRSYHIKNVLVGTHYLPVLTITGKNETNFIQRLEHALNDMKETHPEPVKTKQIVTKKEKPKQGILFDF